MTTKLFCSAAIAITALAAPLHAGGFATEIVEPIIIEPVEPQGSLPGWVIPAIIVAALIGVASQEDDSGTAADNSDDPVLQ